MAQAPHSLQMFPIYLQILSCLLQWISTSAILMIFYMKISMAVPDLSPTRQDQNTICSVGLHHVIDCQILPWLFIIKLTMMKSFWGKKMNTQIGIANNNSHFFIYIFFQRRGTGSNLPMAMKYRTLKETYKKSVGVYRSHIHGRGLFCTRDIEAGELILIYSMSHSYLFSFLYLQVKWWSSMLVNS